MKLKKLAVIVNPASGQDYPILAVINRVLGKHIDWQVSVTKTKNDGRLFARQALMEQVDGVVVYGGDGTVLEVAYELYGSQIPLIILPGGTANILARELTLPLDPVPILTQLAQGQIPVAQIDVGLVNDLPFISRLSTGILAEMVLKAYRQRKNGLGVWAYPFTALESLPEQSPTKFTMTIDGKRIVKQGISLIVANAGNIGIGQTSMVPDCSVVDGILDVIVITKSDLASLVTISAAVLSGRAPNHLLSHWPIKQQATIQIEPQSPVIRDDQILKATTLKCAISNKKLLVMVGPEFDGEGERS